jgi:L-threonylcarbamoyladenylate synthase
MKQLDLKDVLDNKGLESGVIDAIKSGAIFIYPTDTVYGIGCNAENERSVNRIRKIKCTDHPFSVIAPSNDWIRTNLNTVKFNEYLKKLPGPYTLIFKKKSKGYLRIAADGDSIGTRIPKHPFTQLINLANVPFITTSANISGQPTIRSVKEIPEQIMEKIDYVIDGGSLGGKASTVIDLSGDRPNVLRK